MKTTKLVIGIISIVLSLIVMFQACAAGAVNALESNGQVGGSAGFIVAVFLLTAGIIGIATRKSTKKGGSFTAAGFYIAGALIGFLLAGNFSDLYIWSFVSIAFGAVFIIDPFIKKKIERKHIIIGVLVFLVLFIGIAVVSNTGNKATVTDGANTVTNEIVANVGDVITTDQFELTITSIEERGQVGTQYFMSQPSEGGTYVVVNWQYKNISDKPISSFSTPSIKLIDAKKTQYGSDIGASSNYATEANLDSKVLSDLNPGILIKDADVFEIAKDQFATGGWRLYIKADKDAYVNIN